MKINNSNQTSFRGTTQIYAISDSHQETRKTSAFLSKILDENHNNANVLFLNDGDIFKGIYPRELERDCYIKLKESKPDIEMVMTLGNNDFGFNKDSLDYLINTIKTFASKGIHTVCANIFDTSNMRPEWLKPYTIIERDGDKILVTGFCVNNINTGKFGLVPKKQSEVIDELNKAILEEQPDNIIVLNHDYLSSSKEIAKLCKDNGFNIDVIIGGHEHDFVPPDTNLNIYSPKSFSDSMYKMKLSNDNGQTTVSEVEMIENNGLKVSPIFENDIKAYETETKLYDNITPYTLNLTKKYSYPCPLGSFMADSMKEAAGTDLAFISTGFLTKPLEYRKDAYITNYLFQKTLSADNPVRIVELDNSDLKAVFDNALMTHGYGNSNPKFLQCSNNIKITGKNNPYAECFEIKQIFINDEPILDENAYPIKNSKKYSCAVDSYIANGGQGYKVLQQADKKDAFKDSKLLRLNDVLMESLIKAAEKYPKGSEYPYYQINVEND